MAAQNVLVPLREFIVESFLFGEENGNDLRDDTLLIDEGILDSFGVQELLFFLESTFEITINDEEVIADNLNSIGAIATFITEKKDGTG